MLYTFLTSQKLMFCTHIHFTKATPILHIHFFLHKPYSIIILKVYPPWVRACLSLIHPPESYNLQVDFKYPGLNSILRKISKDSTGTLRRLFISKGGGQGQGQGQDRVSVNNRVFFWGGGSPRFQYEVKRGLDINKIKDGLMRG